MIRTCDLGLIKLGLLADLRALSKILDIRFVFVNSAPYIIQKPKPTYNNNIYNQLSIKRMKENEWSNEKMIPTIAQRFSKA